MKYNSEYLLNSELVSIYYRNKKYETLMQYE